MLDVHQGKRIPLHRDCRSVNPYVHFIQFSCHNPATSCQLIPPSGFEQDRICLTEEVCGVLTTAIITASIRAYISAKRHAAVAEIYVISHEHRYQIISFIRSASYVKCMLARDHSHYRPWPCQLTKEWEGRMRCALISAGRLMTAASS